MSGFTHFTSEQLSDLTGVAHSWIVYQASRGAIPHHRAGGDVCFTKADLEALTGPMSSASGPSPRKTG